MGPQSVLVLFLLDWEDAAAKEGKEMEREHLLMLGEGGNLENRVRLDGSLQHWHGTANGKPPNQAQPLLKDWCEVMEVGTISRDWMEWAGGMGEGRRSDLELAVVTDKASAYWTWSGQGLSQRGGAQPLQECVTDLGPHGRTLTGVQA